MEWSSEDIRRLRAAAQMTQRELSEWLSVTVKQVKHLENRRRNPSGPSARLLDMLAEKLQFNGPTPQLQVLATGTKQLEPSPPQSPSASNAEAAANPDEGFVWA